MDIVTTLLIAMSLRSEKVKKDAWNMTQRSGVANTKRGAKMTTHMHAQLK